jgi:hypothetical protein
VSHEGNSASLDFTSGDTESRRKIDTVRTNELERRVLGVETSWGAIQTGSPTTNEKPKLGILLVHTDNVDYLQVTTHDQQTY